MAEQMQVGGDSGQITLSEAVFGRSFNEALVHQVVTAERAAARAGTKQQKGRSDVSGGGKKPWRQKGTGRARAGTIRSPIWVGGGVTFAARPRSFDQKVNKKMYRGAVCSALSALAGSERLSIVADLSLENRKTSDFLEAMTSRGVRDVELLVVASVDDALQYSARNVRGLRVISVAALGVADLVASDKVAVTVSAKGALEEWLG
ncbi:50S ribosomal protein L4 [Salinisphaera sp. USBA-960]|uniref:50S ribosomal protein L4 n=1 Tax=Salinisphaera orenii TaxID=856731 RepID=UPI000DBE8E64|nr:50S ribosomal protein L4 [Salifodinibacter halophilus]NNC26691.1 50S ribosomal protein L4 [Salifodinibacter halophilus]